MSAPFNLERFVTAQDAVYADILRELRAGRKTSHWMWFIFPQVRGLGSSPMAERFAISSLNEARAYLAHHVLGQRLVECCDILVHLENNDARTIFGSPDDLKLKSSMTLFACVSLDGNIFEDVLDKFYGGASDPQTIERL
ncbi:DUF1810 domain-containing protein [Agrobacterium sp. ES01]|uniref:DUF1810 domain-containing protein n=1 Tax=Agrobacterium sp. ES01 TaxID=3420714 RepID=UPI003D110263